MEQNKTPAKTHEKITEVGGKKISRKFSTFDDLAQWAVNTGRATSVDEIRAGPSDLWGALLFEWYTQGQVGCLFAVVLAQAEDKTQWINALVEGDALDAEVITAVIDEAADEGVEAIQLLFPGAGDAQHACAILKVLGGHPRWRCVDVGTLAEEPNCDTHQVGLRWISADETYESWALGLADFDPMALTRRFKGAPFIALVLRPTPPMDDRATPVIGDTGLPAAHVAHMDDGLSSDEVRKKYREGSGNNKRALVHPMPLSRARAKVTFSFDAAAFAALKAEVPLHQPVKKD